MNVVDSSGWLEYFADGPNADFFAPATARAHGAALWTQDEHFEQVEGVRLVGKF
jgi:predicted nucleic acid-binding protein